MKGGLEMELESRLTTRTRLSLTRGDSAVIRSNATVSRRARGNLVAVLASSLLLATGGSAQAVITQSPSNATGANQLAQAMTATAGMVTGAGFVAVPISHITTTGIAADGVGKSPLSFFPTNGTTSAILTSGHVGYADNANTSGSTGFEHTTSFRGAFDVTD